MTTIKNVARLKNRHFSSTYCNKNLPFSRVSDIHFRMIAKRLMGSSMKASRNLPIAKRTFRTDGAPRPTDCGPRAREAAAFRRPPSIYATYTHSSHSPTVTTRIGCPSTRAASGYAWTSRFVVDHEIWTHLRK